LYKQIIACERETEKTLFMSTFEEELQALTQARKEFQVWIDSTPSTISPTEVQVKTK
jgi:hypothetical protein